MKESIGDLRPYRVRLSIVYEYLTLAASYEDACSIEDAKEAKQHEIPPPSSEWQIEAEETDLAALPRDWPDGTYLYGPLNNVSVADVREILAERAAAEMVVGERVYDRRMDLFGRIETVTTTSAAGKSVERTATIKYEFPCSPDAEPREV